MAAHFHDRRHRLFDRFDRADELAGGGAEAAIGGFAGGGLRLCSGIFARFAEVRPFNLRTICGDWVFFPQSLSVVIMKINEISGLSTHEFIRGGLRERSPSAKPIYRFPVWAENR